MSAETAGPETLGSLSDEPEQSGSQQPAGQGDLRQVADADRAGPSGPRQDRRRLRGRRPVLHHLRRLRRPDQQPLRRRASRRRSPASASTASTRACPSPRWARPTARSPWTTRWVSRPRTGEDNLAYWLYGCRVSLLIATTATLFASVVGVDHRPALRLPRRRGRQGAVVLHRHVPHDPVPAGGADHGADHQRAVQHSPTTTGRSRSSALVVVLAIFGWMGTARLIRGEVLSLREREFVQAARVMGMPTCRILFKELLPNLAAPIIISVSLMLPAFVAARGRPGLPRHRRHRRRLVGPDDPQGHQPDVLP